MNNKIKKTIKSHKPEQHSWFKRFSIGREVFTINFSVKQKPVKEANKSFIFKRRKEIKRGLSYGGQAFAAVVLLTVIVSMLSWSALIWNKSVQERYRPIQLLRSTLGSFGQLAMDTIAGQNKTSASSTAPSIFSLITKGVKKEFGSIASGVKKQIVKISPANNTAKTSSGATSSVPAAPNQPPTPPPVVVEPVPVKMVVATTTATTTPVVKKVEPVKPVVVKATTTPVVVKATTTPVVKEPEPVQPQTIVQYIVNQSPTVEYPDTTITASPALVTSSTSANFSFSSSKTVVVYAYSLDNGSWITVGTSTALSGLAEGNHVFKVRSTDSAGPDPSPAQYDWRIDLSPPTVNFVSAPGSYINTTTASFTFGANETATYYYQLDADEWLSTTTPITISGLDEGAHVMSLYGIDGLGFQGAIIEVNWLVDLLSPSAYLNSLTSTTGLDSFNSNGLTVSFGGTDQNMPDGSGVANYDVEYAINGGGWQQWNQLLGQNFAVYGQPMTEGQIASFRVRAYDGAGNVGEWSTSKQTRFADTSPDHVVISEVQISGSSETDEFIELYNPTNDAITLSSDSYSLSYKDSGGTEFSLVSNFMNIQIDAQGYILVAHADYGGDVIADLAYSSAESVPTNATIILKQSGEVIDKLGFGLAADFELAPFVSNPSNNESLERKAVATSTAGMMVNGAVHHLSGNGYDSNSNLEDFVLRIQPDPQSVDSGTETLALISGFGLKLAMARTVSMLDSVWFSLVKNWINPAKLEVIDDFISNTILELKNEIVAAHLSIFDRGCNWGKLAIQAVYKQEFLS